MLKRQFFSLVLVCCLSLGVFDIAFANTVDVSGDWQGNWTSYVLNDSSGYPISGGLNVHINQSGTTLSGSLTISNTECGTFNDLSLSGSVSFNFLTVNASATCSLDGSSNSLEFTSGNVNGNSIFGYYTVYSDGFYYDSGTFTLTRAINIITASAGAGGTIEPSGQVSVSAGANQTFQIIPSTGYTVLDVNVDGVSVGPRTSYTFNNLSSNHTITATFNLAPTITIMSLPSTDDDGNYILEWAVTGPASPPWTIHEDSDTNFTSPTTYQSSDTTSPYTHNFSNKANGTYCYRAGLSPTGPFSDSTCITVQRKAMPWLPLLLE